jgi:ATP-dependent Clp endopeptidase proteolytic subunit ClpP
MKYLSLLMLLVLVATGATKPQERIITLTTKNVVTFRGMVDFSSVKKAQEDLIKADAARADVRDPIYLVIDSPGGNIDVGIRFIEFANTIPNIKTICMFCASMAHAFAQAINGERLATKTNIMMAHRAKGGIQGQFNDGELESRLALYKKIVTEMEQTNADRIGVSLKEYKSKVVNEWWTSGADSKAQGVVDDIVTVKCSKELLTATETYEETSFFGESRTITLRKCPLILN